MVWASYLSHVSWGVRVLGTEDRANAVHPLPSASNLQLLVELWGLCQEGLLVKVRQAEDVGTTLGGGTNQAWGLE